VGAYSVLLSVDALGTTLEFKRPGTFKPIKGMIEDWAIVE